MGGHSLGEGASIQEISEQILYYHRDQKWSTESSSGLPTPRTKTSLTEEAVQFLGLCSALYGLPASFGDPGLAEERTKQIFFGNSTLVFVMLESSPDLLAVAQISRLYQQGNKSETGGGNPLAIRTSIERCHQLFCLLRGGGILKRLEPSIGTMGELYAILKQVRKESEQNSRSRGSSRLEADENNFEGKIFDLQNEVRVLRKKLPIQSIRRDLDAHYKEYLAHQGLAMNRNGGAGRCLVETIPEPMARVCGTHALQSSSASLSTFSIMSLGLSTRRLLDEFVVGSEHDISLFGISIFVDGQLLHSHWSNDSLSRRLEEDDCSPVSISVPNEMIYLVNRYMTSYSVKMSQLPSSKREGASVSSELGIRKIAMAFGDPTSTFAPSIEANDGASDPPKIMSKFIAPPPQFMMSATEEADFITISSQQTKAWALKVCIPVQVSYERSEKQIPFQFGAIVCEVENCSFLLFLDDGSFGHVSDSLSIVESRLTDIVLVAEETDRDTDFLGQHEKFSLQWTEPGQDVVVVNREQNMLYLFSDRKRKDNTKASTATSTTRRFLGFGTKSHSSSGESERSRSTQHLEWATLGLDCRHRLASHLHLDTMLAFDDMMNEIALRRKLLMREDDVKTIGPTANPTRSGVVELCTCMPLGWVYACAAEEMELYAFFDSSIYVTVADVQTAATKIQDQFFGRRKTES